MPKKNEIIENVQTETPVEPPLESLTETPQNFTFDDLRIVAGAIELGASRGAYRVDEFKSIGNVWERLNAFLATTQNRLQEQAEQAEVLEE